MTAPTLFRYAMVNRPAMLGAIPSRLLYEVEPRPAKGEPHHDMARHGILVTERELTEGEVVSFELAPLFDEARTAALVELVARDLREHAGSILEMHKDEPLWVESCVISAANRGVQHRFSLADDAAFTAAVLAKLRDAQ